MKNHFRIESDRPIGGRVWLNGAELKEIRSVRTSMEVDSVQTVTIEFCAASINAPTLPTRDKDTDLLVEELAQIFKRVSESVRADIIDGIRRGKYFGA